MHSQRGHEYELLALRIRWPDGGIPETPVELFASGNDAADHGQAQLGDPTPEAVHAINRLIRHHARLRDTM